MLNLISQLTKKQKIMSIIAASLVVVLIGLGAYLYKTGRLSFKADTAGKYNITISGTATDSVTKKPIVGATVTAVLTQGQSTSKTIYSATTSSSGTYKMPTTFAVNPSTDRVDIIITGKNIAEIAAGATTSSPTHATLALPATAPAGGAVTQNFYPSTYASTPTVPANLTKVLSLPSYQNLSVPQIYSSHTSTGTASPVAATVCNQNLQSGFKSNGGVSIDGITFCPEFLSSAAPATTQNASYWTSTYNTSINPRLTIIAKLLNGLEKPYNGNVQIDAVRFLTDSDFSQIIGGSGGAFVDFRTNTISIDEKYVLQLSDNQTMIYFITHEFGHILDVDLGPIQSTLYLPGGHPCVDISGGNGTNYHCPFSDTQTYDSIQTILTTSHVLDGYAAANNHEFFAELFAEEATPTDDFQHFLLQEKALGVVTDYQLMGQTIRSQFCLNSSLVCNNKFPLPAGLSFDTSHSYINFAGYAGIQSPSLIQNNLYYAYLTTAQVAGFYLADGTFDMTTKYSNAQISAGKFVSAAIAPVVVKDSSSKQLGNISIKIGSISDTTETKQAGDLFDTTGTRVLTGVTSGTAAINIPKLPAGDTCYSPTSIALVQGANPVTTIVVGNPGYSVASLGDSSIFTSGSPKWVAVDKTSGSTKGKIYAVDAGHKGVNVFDSSGTPSSIFTGLTSPSGIVVDNSGNILIADGNQIVMYSSAGTKLASYGTPTAGNGTAQLSSPKGLAIDSSNIIYVADSGNKRILELTENPTAHTFTYLKTISTTGADPTVQGSPIVPVTPIAIAVDSKKNIYFTTLTLATGSTTQYNSNLYKIGVTDGKISMSASALNYNSESIKDLVNGVAVDADDNVYYTTQYANPIVKITANSTTTSNIDVAKSGANGLAVDATGYIYAGNSAGMRIDKYTPMCK